MHARQLHNPRARSLALPLVCLVALALGTGAQVATGSTANASSSPIRPHPDNAQRARGPLPKDGCFLSAGETRSPRCVYGDPRSDRRVVLFGDSHAMHYYPGLRRIVRSRDWRLLVLTKAGCPPMLAVKRGRGEGPTECSSWRRSALRRIGRREAPDMVIAGGSLNYRIYGEDGEPLDGEAREGALQSSYERVLRRLQRTGARTVVMKDVPKAPFDVPSCVAEFMDRPRRCDFELPADHWQTFDTRAARATGSKLVAVTRSICVDRRCRAVIRRRLVYRAGSHLTAPFARTLREVLARQLPDVR